jgi:hypothetical protein
MGAFAMAVHKGRFSGPDNAPLAKSLVSRALDLVAATFWENRREVPK